MAPANWPSSLSTSPWRKSRFGQLHAPGYLFASSLKWFDGIKVILLLRGRPAGPEQRVVRERNVGVVFRERHELTLRFGEIPVVK